MLDLYRLLLLKKLSGDSGGGGGETVLINNKNISANGEYSASSDDADGYKKVTVAVPVPTLESKSVSANGTYTPESGKAWNEVEVDVPSYENRTIMLGNTTITGGSPFPDVLEVDCRVQGTSSTLSLTPIYSELGKTVIIDLQGNNVPLITMTTGANEENAVEKITCSKNPALEIIVMGSSQVFRHCNHLTDIRPALNFENLTSDFSRYWDNNGGASLSYVRCVANSAKINFNFSNSSLLTDDSIVSIANACNGTVAKTLTLHATPKARCNSIMGTVSSVTEDGVTYDFFTADAGGSTTLANFITQTKGWTLA